MSLLRCVRYDVSDDEGAAWEHPNLSLQQAARTIIRQQAVDFARWRGARLVELFHRDKWLGVADVDAQ